MIHVEEENVEDETEAEKVEEEAVEILCEPEPDPVPHSRLNRNNRKTEEVS